MGTPARKPATPVKKTKVVKAKAPVVKKTVKAKSKPAQKVSTLFFTTTLTNGVWSIGRSSGTGKAPKGAFATVGAARNAVIKAMRAETKKQVKNLVLDLNKRIKAIRKSKPVVA